MFLNNEQFTYEQQALLLRRVAELVGSGDCGYLIPRQVTQLTAYHDTSETIFYCMRIMQRAMVISLSRRDKEPVYADHLTHLAAQLQLCAAAVVDIHCLRDDEDVDLILEDISLGRQALEIALNMEATVFISQPIVQRYIKRKWYSLTLASLNHILPTPEATRVAADGSGPGLLAECCSCAAAVKLHSSCPWPHPSQGAKVALYCSTPHHQIHL